MAPSCRHRCGVSVGKKKWKHYWKREQSRWAMYRNSAWLRLVDRNHGWVQLENNHNWIVTRTGCSRSCSGWPEGARQGEIQVGRVDVFDAIFNLTIFYSTWTYRISKDASKPPSDAIKNTNSCVEKCALQFYAAQAIYRSSQPSLWCELCFVFLLCRRRTFIQRRCTTERVFVPAKCKWYIFFEPSIHHLSLSRIYPILPGGLVA